MTGLGLAGLKWAGLEQALGPAQPITIYGTADSPNHDHHLTKLFKFLVHSVIYGIACAGEGEWSKNDRFLHSHILLILGYHHGHGPTIAWDIVEIFAF